MEYARPLALFLASRLMKPEDHLIQQMKRNDVKIYRKPLVETRKNQLTRGPPQIAPGGWAEWGGVPQTPGPPPPIGQFPQQKQQPSTQPVQAFPGGQVPLKDTTVQVHDFIRRKQRDEQQAEAREQFQATQPKPDEDPHVAAYKLLEGKNEQSRGSSNACLLRIIKGVGKFGEPNTKPKGGEFRDPLDVVYLVGNDGRVKIRIGSTGSLCESGSRALSGDEYVIELELPNVIHDKTYAPSLGKGTRFAVEFVGAGNKTQVEIPAMSDNSSQLFPYSQKHKLISFIKILSTCKLGEPIKFYMKLTFREPVGRMVPDIERSTEGVFIARPCHPEKAHEYAALTQSAPITKDDIDDKIREVLKEDLDLQKHLKELFSKQQTTGVLDPELVKQIMRDLEHLKSSINTQRATQFGYRKNKADDDGSDGPPAAPETPSSTLHSLNPRDTTGGDTPAHDLSDLQDLYGGTRRGASLKDFLVNVKDLTDDQLIKVIQDLSRKKMRITTPMEPTVRKTYEVMAERLKRSHLRTDKLAKIARLIPEVKVVMPGEEESPAGPSSSPQTGGADPTITSPFYDPESSPAPTTPQTGAYADSGYRGTTGTGKGKTVTFSDVETPIQPRTLFPSTPEGSGTVPGLPDPLPPTPAQQLPTTSYAFGATPSPPTDQFGAPPPPPPFGTDSGAQTSFDEPQQPQTTGTQTTEPKGTQANLEAKKNFADEYIEGLSKPSTADAYLRRLERGLNPMPLPAYQSPTTTPPNFTSLAMLGGTDGGGGYYPTGNVVGTSSWGQQPAGNTLPTGTTFNINVSNPFVNPATFMSNTMIPPQVSAQQRTFAALNVTNQ